MSIASHAAAALLAAAIAATGAWQVQNWRFDARELERVQAQAAATQQAARAANTAAAAHEQDKTHAAQKTRVIRQIVEKIVERPVYAGVCFDRDGLRALATAIKPGDLAAQPGDAVP